MSFSDRQGATAAIAREGGGPQAVAGLAAPIVARFLNRIAGRGLLRPDITITEATEWLVDVHVTLLSPLFADRPVGQTCPGTQECGLPSSHPSPTTPDWLSEVVASSLRLHRPPLAQAGVR